MVKKKKTKNKVLQAECLKLAIEICKARDKGICQLHKYYKNIRLEHAGYMQADHGISRACKKYFVDPRNLTWVCGSANRAKHFKLCSVDEAIRQIVIDREGQEFWDEMVQWNQSEHVFKEWGQVWWLEEQKEKLEKELNLLKT